MKHFDPDERLPSRSSPEASDGWWVARDRTCGAGGSAEFLGESDEKPFRPADVAEPIRVFILDDLAYELCAAPAESLERVVDVVHGEHDAEIA